MRILVTGSRNFRRPHIIREALHLIAIEQPGTHTLVHGGSRGADKTAAAVAKTLRWNLEAHPAQWTRPCEPDCRHRGGRQQRSDGTEWCPAAGYLRNEHMVSLGADLVLAFHAVDEANRGTKDCVRRARKAGLVVQEFRA